MTQPVIKNIIFDLGGVLMNLDYNKTAAAFKALGYVDFDNMYSQFKADELFEKLETGRISEEDFYTVLKKVASKPITDEQIMQAWTAMLLDFRAKSIASLPDLAKKYNLFLLSNTNSIHVNAFRKIFEQQFGHNRFEANFAKAYYSNEIGMRKPNADVYEFVLQDSGLKAAETLLIDDTHINIVAATALGLHTHFLKQGETIETLGL